MGSSALLFDYTNKVLIMADAAGTIELNPANQSIAVSNNAGAYSQMGTGGITTSDGGAVSATMDGMSASLVLTDGVFSTNITSAATLTMTDSTVGAQAYLSAIEFDLTDGSANNINLDVGLPSIQITKGASSATLSLNAGGGALLTASALLVPSLPSATTTDILYYDTATGAITQGTAPGTAFPAITVQPAAGTVALLPAMNRSTYILTGAGPLTQTFDPAGLAGEPAGFCVYLRNGNNAFGGAQDINIAITGVVGAVTLHTITTTTNSGGMLLYWDGAALTRYR